MIKRLHFKLYQKELAEKVFKYDIVRNRKMIVGKNNIDNSVDMKPKGFI